MIKAVLKSEQGNFRTLVLGLSERNIQRLKKREPILFNAEELGIPDWCVLIVYGSTEEAIEADIMGGFKDG